MENYMDKFDTPEAFIRAEVLANRGTQNIVDKDELIWMVAHQDPNPDRNYAKMSKAELFDLLVELVGADAYTMFPVGVSSRCWQLKFGIEHKDVLKMAKKEFIATTGEVRFRLYGRYCYAKTYSPYDYFRLTAEEVHNWLNEHSRKRNSAKKEEV